MTTNSTAFITRASLISVALLCLFSLIFVWNNLFERVDAGEDVVIQSVFGNLTIYTNPGFELKLFGKATHYRKSFQFWFSKLTDQGSNRDDSIHIRFNDGGQAQVSGSIRVDLPTTEKELLDLHNTYGSQEAVEQQLIRTNIERSIFMTGPLMSSKESYAEKRNDLISDIEDQCSNGVFKTASHTQEIVDPVSGDKKQIALVDIVLKDGTPEREESSPLTRFGVHIYSMSINAVTYDPVIERQIASQQEATMQVQTAIANSKKAEQDALTAAKEGEADAAKAEWEQKALNAKLVAEAEGRKQAAEEDEKAAEFQKQKTIALAEGESTAKKLLAQANNSLGDRLAAYQAVNQAYALAIQNMRVPLVPSVVMGGNSGNSSTGTSSSVTDLINMLQVKTAKDLSVNLDMAPLPVVDDAVKRQ